MKLRTLLDLARISNLPTVWSNVLAGAVLGIGQPDVSPVVAAGLAGSLLYSGGMLLNDAFDATIDARERPERPIPSGRVARRTVFLLGFGLLVAALGLLAAFEGSLGGDHDHELFVTGCLVAVAIVVYDRFHKGIAWSPIVMGLCRAGLYVMGAFAVSPWLASDVLLPASSLLLYVVGLTHVARFENASAVGRVWPTLFLFAPVIVVLSMADYARDAGELVPLAVVLAVHVAWTVRALVIALRGGRGSIPRAVVALIAGISLVDAAFIALAGHGVGGVLGASAAFSLTLLFQRWVRGT